MGLIFAQFTARLRRRANTVVTQSAFDPTSPPCPSLLVDLQQRRSKLRRRAFVVPSGVLPMREHPSSSRKRRSSAGADTSIFQDRKGDFKAAKKAHGEYKQQENEKYTVTAKRRSRHLRSTDLRGLRIRRTHRRWPVEVAYIGKGDEQVHLMAPKEKRFPPLPSVRQNRALPLSFSVV